MAKRRVPPSDPATHPRASEQPARSGESGEPSTTHRQVAGRSVADLAARSGERSTTDRQAASRSVADQAARSGERSTTHRQAAGRSVAEQPAHAGGRTTAGQAVSVVVRVRPGAGRTRVGGRYEGPHGPALIVAVGAPAVDGKATEAVGRALAEALGVRRRDVVLRVGATSRDKVFLVDGDVSERLGALRDGSA